MNTYEKGCNYIVYIQYIFMLFPPVFKVGLQLCIIKKKAFVTAPMERLCSILALSIALIFKEKQSHYFVKAFLDSKESGVSVWDPKSLSTCVLLCSQSTIDLWVWKGGCMCVCMCLCIQDCRSRFGLFHSLFWLKGGPESTWLQYQESVNGTTERAEAADKELIVSS